MSVVVVDPIAELLATGEGRFEWSDGSLIETAPTSPDHVRKSTFLTTLFQLYVDARGFGEVFGDRLAQRVGPGKARVRDVSFFKKENLRKIGPTNAEGAADLIVEIVSPDSRVRDRRDKFFEYAKAGVEEYWIVDPERRTADFYRLDDGVYDRVEPDNEGRVHSSAMPGFFLRVGWPWNGPTLQKAMRESGAPVRMRRRAFTLTELLTVIAIVAVLTGIAFPVFGAVRRRAQHASCAENLHQLGLALTLYANDHEGWVPPATTAEFEWEAKPGTPVADLRASPQVLRTALASYVRNDSVWFCPTDPRAHQDVLWLGQRHLLTSYFLFPKMPKEPMTWPPRMQLGRDPLPNKPAGGEDVPLLCDAVGLPWIDSDPRIDGDGKAVSNHPRRAGERDPARPEPFPAFRSRVGRHEGVDRLPQCATASKQAGPNG